MSSTRPRANAPHSHDGNVSTSKSAIRNSKFEIRGPFAVKPATRNSKLETRWRLLVIVVAIALVATILTTTAYMQKEQEQKPGAEATDKAKQKEDPASKADSVAEAAIEPMDAPELPSVGDFSILPFSSSTEKAAELTRPNAPLAGLTGTKNIPGDYATLAAAVTDLNLNGVGSGGVTFNVIAANPQTAPVGGYVIGGSTTGPGATPSLVLTTSSAANPITFTGNSNTVTAGTPQSVGAVNDAVIKLVGADFVTIQGFTIQENAANTVFATSGTNTMTEFGVALFYVTATDGAKNNTIQNNTITLNRAYATTIAIFSTSRTNSTAVTTTAEATTTGGTNTDNHYYGNNISNTNYAIALISASPAALHETGNDIGGSSAATGNTITNFSTGTAQLSSISTLTGSNYAIFLNHQINDNVSFNSITGAAVTSSVTQGGILKNYSVAIPTGTITTTINNNTVTVTNNPTAATTGGIIGINNQGLTTFLSTATMSMNNNTVQNCVLGGATSTTNGITAITNLSLPGTLNMTGNNVLNNSITATTATTGIVAGISNSGAAGTVNINTNIIRGFASTATSGQVQPISNTGAVVTALNINSNQLGNASGGLFSTSTATSGTLFGIVTSGGASTCALSIQTNDIRGITYNVAASAAQAYYQNSATTLSQNISSNTFTNLNVNTTGSVTFISNSVAAPAAGFKTINSNSIVTAFNKGGAGGTITLYNDGASSVTTTPVQNNSNNFSNITVTGATTIAGWFNNDGTGSTPQKTMTGNTFSNWTGGTSSIIVLQANFGGSNTMSTNTITNITGQGAITGLLVGSSGTIATLNVASNTVTGLSSTGAGGAVIGISSTSPATTVNISSNAVNTLSSTGAVAVSGIVNSAGTTANIFKNKIYDVSGSNAASTVNGLLVSGGTTVNAFNNLIGDLRTPAANTANPLIGISVTGGTTVAAYYNTVYLNASSSGSPFGSSAISASTTPTLILRNNIFVNASTPAGAGLSAAYRRSTTTLTTYDSTSNNNDFFAPTIFNDGTNTDSTIAAYKTRVSTRDSASFSENPTFISTTGSSVNFLHINTGVATQIESGAVNISGITDDYDAQTRQGNGGYAGTGTAPDVGADEFNGIPQDLTAPAITYTLIANTLCTTAPTLSATITDGTGVNTTAGTKPRLYFKKSGDANTVAGNTSANNGWKFVEATNSSSPFSFTLDYSLLQSAVVATDVIQYFVVAQDTATTPNVGINSGIFNATPSSVALTAAAFPITGTINSFTILSGGLSGTVTIGAAGTYPTLTGAGGLFAAINTGGLSGDLTANIVDASITENGVTALNAITYGCATYTLTIKPGTGVTSTLTGSSTGAIIKLNGADRVIIDGSNNGTASRDLTITNTNTGTSSVVVWIASASAADGANNDTVKNCVIRGNASTTTLAAINIGGTTATGTVSATQDNDNTIQNNLVAKAQFGMLLAGSSTTVLDQNLMVLNNTLGTSTAGDGFSTVGLFIRFEQAATVSGNDVQNVTGSGSTNMHGISINDTKSSTISANKIHTSSYTGSSTTKFYGLYSTAGSFNAVGNPSNNLYVNNAVYDLSSACTSGVWCMSGINNEGAYGDKYYFNSVSLSGTLTGSTASGSSVAAFSIGNGSVSAVATSGGFDIRDNIFSVTGASSGAITSYTHHTTLANYTGSTLNYNDLYSAPTGSITGKIGRINATDQLDIAAWRTASGEGINSISVNPQFNSATNLQPQLGSPVLDTGVTLSGTVTPYVDITGATRVDPPSMGAYESGSDTVGPTISYTLLANTTSTSNRAFSAVTVTDTSGVNGTAGTRPRVYYKRSGDTNAFNDNTSGTNGWKFVEANGSTSPFDFTINYSLLNGGTGVTAGQTVQYFVVAQDLAATPNVSINSGTFTTQPTSVALTSAAFPIGGTINSYSISASISGTKTVCASGCDYATLTGASGVFNAINTSVTTGSIEIQIAGDLTAGETGAVALNALAVEPVNSTYLVKIYPTGTIRAITSTTAPAGGFIRLNAADNVTIDGSIGGTGTDRSLTITEANTGTTSAVIWLQSSGTDGATSNTIKNLNVVGNANTTTLIGIGMGANGDSTVSVSSLGTSNNSNTIQNNNISKTQYGIYSQGASAGSKNTGNVITQNQMNTAATSNVAKGGILLGFENSITISQNTIDGINNSSDDFGINLGLGTSFSNTSTTGNDVTNATVVRNTVGSVVCTGTNTAFGIAVAGVTSGTTQIANNFVYGVTANSTSPDIAAGIFIGGATGSTTQIYSNSVSMVGDRGIGTTFPSYALAVSGSNPTIDVRDNILFNTQTTVGLGKSYAIGLAYSTYTNLTSDYNDLFTSGAQGAFGQTGGLGTSGTDRTSLSAWQTQTAKDANSKSADPLFTSTTNLHINPATAATSPVNNAGISIGSVTNDFDNDSRSSTPDIGADEFVVNVSTSGSANLAAGTYDNVTVNSPDTLTLTGNVAIYGCLIVNSGGTLNMGTNVVSGPGCFTLNSGGNLGIGSTVGITTGGTGNVQVSGTRTFSTGGNYIYNGAANQAVGNALPSTVANLTIANTGVGGSNTVTGNSGQTVTGLLRVQSGVYAGASTYNNVQIDNLATMTAASAGTINVIGSWTNNGTFNANGSTVIFNGDGNTQTLSGSTSFANLTINHANAGGVTASGSTLAVTALMRVQGGTFTSSSTFNNVQIDSTGTLISDGGTMNVSGDWTNDGGTFTPSTGTVNFNSTSAGQTLQGSASTQTFNILTVSKTGQILGLGGSLATLNVGTLNVNAGTFDQGTSASLAAGPITIAAGATLKNLGTGDLTLLGGVANAGTITMDGGGGGCGSADSILIRSSLGGTQRAWSGTGTFSLTDVDVQDQAGTAIITVFSGTSTANNGANWVFVNACTGAGGNTYVWNPTVGNSWVLPANWKVANSSPATPRTLAAATDVLIFDGSSTPAPTVSNVASTDETVAALRVINGAFPVFSTDAAHTLTIDAGSGALGFDVDSLTVSGANALTIKLASGTLGRVTGVMTVGGGAHKLIGQAASAITFQTNSFFTTTTGFTGNPFGDGSNAANGAAGSIVFASGSTYSHNAGSSPFGASGNASVVTFQTGSLAQYLTATGFDANGRTYANLTIGKAAPGAIEVDASDSGAGNFQFDDLVINSTGTADSSLTFAGSGTNAITIQGNITSTGTGTGGTLPDVMLTPGSGGITINKSGTATFSNTGNSRSIDFEGNATVTNGTTLALARIVQLGFANPNSKTLTVNATGDISGGTNGYVIGSVKKNSVAAGFIFPVGINGYSPVQLTTINGTGDFTTSASATTIPGLAIPGKGLTRYWTLTNGGLTDARVKFTYLDADIPGTSTEANYRIVKDTNGTGTGFTFPDAGNDDVDDATNTATLINPVSTFSNWSLAEPDAPTAVKLMSFTAVREQSGEVTLRWQSGYEAHNLGYYVYREENGKRTQLTPSLVAGSALTTGPQTMVQAGLAYTWIDRRSEVGDQRSEVGGQRSAATYWLEDVDLDGTRTLHGPIAVEDCNTGSVKCKASDAKLAQRSPTFGEVNSKFEIRNSKSSSGTLFREWPAAAETKAQPAKVKGNDMDPVEVQRWLANQPGVKISVSKSGWYRLYQPELQEAGLDTRYGQQLQLYTDGREVPMVVTGSGAELSSSEYIEFYGQGIDPSSVQSTTEGVRTYYLVNRKVPGTRIAMTETVTTDPSGAQNFSSTIERRDRWIYYAALLNGEAENIFGHIVSGTAMSETLPVKHPDTAGSPARLEVSLVGVSLEAHQVLVNFNGQDVGTIDFASAGHPTTAFTVPASLVQEGNNTVQLTALGGATDVSLVDTVALTYSRTFEVDKNALQLTVNDPQTRRITGFTDKDIRVVDVYDAEAQIAEMVPVVELQPDGTFAANVYSPGASLHKPHRLLVFGATRTSRPDALQANKPSSWWEQTDGADYLIITSQDFLANVEPLAQLRRNQGMVVKVVDVADLYDEFSFGVHTPQAVHDFLQLTQNSWTRKPHFVLLAGDASYDPKNYLGQGNTDFVPTKLFDTSLMETASDDWLADFNGDGVAELAIGRLPLRTAADADLMVNKIISYENTAIDPQRGALLVADTGFESQSAAAQSQLPPTLPQQVINRSSADDATIHNQIITSLNQGPRLVNFVGHGGNGTWTGALLLTIYDAPDLTNTNHLSVYVMMTCMNGYFQNAYIDSLGESLLRNQGGAVAVWASTGMTEPGPQSQIDQELYRQMFLNSPPTLGDAVRAARLATGDSDVRRTWILFGDPAMRLR